MLHFETIIPETRFILEDLMQKEDLKNYRLVGGTALALYKGHRISDDLDMLLDSLWNVAKRHHLQPQFKE